MATRELAARVKHKPTPLYAAMAVDGGYVVGEVGNYGKPRHIPLQGTLGERQPRKYGPLLPVQTRKQALTNYGAPFPATGLYRRTHSHRTACGHETRACVPVKGTCRATTATFRTCTRCSKDG